MHFNLALIPAMPFLGAALIFLFGRNWGRTTIHGVTITTMAVALAQSVVGYFARLPAAEAAGGALRDHLWTWIASGSLQIELALRMDALSGLLCLVITFIGTLIHIYSWGYMAHDAGYARFFAYLNLFCGAMLTLVLGDSLPVMFVGWEGVGLCSYLLIGFWYSHTPNADAGKKAFITNRVGDFAFILGMLLLFEHTGSMGLSAITAAATPDGPLSSPLWLGQPVAFWAGLLLFVGACGKSAQIPLYVWLPDAMAGPTPVSALIHAATMVTAGVYMVARMSAVYMLAPAAMAIVAVVGAATALFAAVIGFAQNDFKKVLAYSTVSQLGFMFAGVGTANFAGGILHLYTHAFFKAGLFLCAGSVMHAMSGSGDITKMGGLKDKLPYTHRVFWVCWLAICGVPLFSGFFSKDAIVAGAFATHVYPESLAWVGKVVGAALLLAALGTAFYMSRLYYLVFSGDGRADAHTRSHIHESPVEMVGPLVVLAVGAALAGYVGVPGGVFGHAEWNLLAHKLEPAVGKEMHVPANIEIAFMVLSTAIAAAGILLARLFYRGGYQDPAHRFAFAFPRFVALVRDKFRVDEIYGALIVRPLRFLAHALYVLIDRVLIDQILVAGTAGIIDAFGRVSRAFQVGDGQRYIAVVTLGAAGLIFFATRPPAPGDLKVSVDGMTVDVDASRGGRASTRRLRYEFDFNGDGKPDQTGDGPGARHVYDEAGSYTISVRIRDPKWLTSTVLEHDVVVR